MWNHCLLDNMSKDNISQGGHYKEEKYKIEIIPNKELLDNLPEQSQILQSSRLRMCLSHKIFVKTDIGRGC